MKSLVIAPHADDELLGCAGTILRNTKLGNEVGIHFVTSLTKKGGWTTQQIKKREKEIKLVIKDLGVEDKNIFKSNFEATAIDELKLNKMIINFSSIIKKFKPENLFLPFYGDIHSEHRKVFDAAMSSSKWFRQPSIKNILMYETVSETEFNPKQSETFSPNYFVDISEFIDQKIRLINIYQSEIKNFPFPRSNENIIALSKFRGAQSGFNAAESFMIVKSRV